MGYLDAHALGYEGTLKLSAESKAERVSAHLDQISKDAQLQMQAWLWGRGVGTRPELHPLLQLHASSYSLAQCLHLEKTRIPG